MTSGRTRSGISRRSLLKGGGGAAFAVGSLASLKLFNVPDAKQNPMNCMAKDVSATQKELIVSNWPAYIDPIKKSTSTLQEFEQQTGISVSYTDDISDNSEFFAKVRNQLGACQPIGRDIMILTDWMAGRVINLGWIQPLDAKQIPNVHENLIPALQGREWDPDLKYHAPWQSGLTGIAYNAKETAKVSSIEELLTRKDLKGRITMLTEMRDTMGFMLRVVGAKPEKFTKDEWTAAINKLDDAVSAGQIRAFTGNEYIQDLTAGNIVACEAWSGDVIQAQYDNPNIKFVPPTEGVSLWADNMLVPNQASHTLNAEKWMNYYYEPEVAAKLAAWVNYICPVKGAQQEMEKIDKTLVDNPLIFPTEDDLKDAFSFMALNEEQNTEYERDWSNVIGG
ncbi:MAG: spermidine/putrescine ABC transporter substrate-binding protein [Nocardioides sp.]